MSSDQQISFVTKFRMALASLLRRPRRTVQGPRLRAQSLLAASSRVSEVLETAAILGLLLGVLTACSTTTRCNQYDLTLCGTQPISVTACVQTHNSNKAIVTGIPNPPSYLDVAPVNSASWLSSSACSVFGLFPSSCLSLGRF